MCPTVSSASGTSPSDLRTEVAADQEALQRGGRDNLWRGKTSEDRINDLRRDRGAGLVVDGVGVILVGVADQGGVGLDARIVHVGRYLQHRAAAVAERPDRPDAIAVRTQ